MLGSVEWCKDEVAGISSTDCLLSSCQKLLEATGIGHVSYARTDLSGLSCVATSYPRNWRTHYSQNALHEVDPVIAASRVDSTLQSWSPQAFGRQSGAFFELAHSFGVPTKGAAVTFQTRTGFSIFSVAYDGSCKAWERELEANKVELNLIAMAFCVRASHLINQVHLSPRERDVLLWTARGKTSWETGQILGLTEGTVNQYLRCAMKKTGASNRVHCVAQAIELGLLSAA